MAGYNWSNKPLYIPDSIIASFICHTNRDRNNNNNNKMIYFSKQMQKF